MKRELTRARSKLEEEKTIRGNIQVDISFIFSVSFDSFFFFTPYVNLPQADLEQYQERVRVCMESMDRFCFFLHILIIILRHSLCELPQCRT